MKWRIPDKKREKNAMPKNKTVFLVKGVSGRQAIFGNIVEVFNQGPIVTSDYSDFDSFEITGVSETMPAASKGSQDRNRLTVHFEYHDGKEIKRNGTMWIEQLEVIE